METPTNPGRFRHDPVDGFSDRWASVGPNVLSSANGPPTASNANAPLLGCAAYVVWLRDQGPVGQAAGGARLAHRRGVASASGVRLESSGLPFGEVCDVTVALKFGQCTRKTALDGPGSDAENLSRSRLAEVGYVTAIRVMCPASSQNHAQHWRHALAEFDRVCAGVPGGAAKGKQQHGGQYLCQSWVWS